jgi:hypothetical protein
VIRPLVNAALDRLSAQFNRNRCEASTYAFHARMGMMGAIPA